MTKIKPLSENRMAIYNIASTVLVASINFITIPIFTRLLDTEGFGIVNVYVAWVQIFTILVGLKADGSIGSAQANLPETEQDSYHYSVLMMSLAVFAAEFFAVLLALHPLSELLGMSPVLTVCMMLQSFGAFIIAFFNMRFIFKKQAQKNFLVSVGLCLATTLVSIVLIMAVFEGDHAYFGRIVGLAVPTLLIGVGLFAAICLSNCGSLKLDYWKFCLVLTLPLILHGLSQLLLSRTGMIALQRFNGDSVAGIYSLAVVIVSLLGGIYAALNNAFVPFMYDDLAGKSGEDVKQSHFRNYFTSFTMGTCAFALMVPEVLRIMSTETYWSAIEVLPMLVFGQYCVFLYGFPVNYEFYRMKTRSVAIGTVLAAALNVVLTIVLVPEHGMVGAAFATMVAYVGLFVFHFLIARFALGDRNYPVGYYAVGLAGTAFVCLSCYPLAGLPIIRWVIAFMAISLVAVRIYKTRSIF